MSWKPTKKQTEALICEEYEILYGGARGGGKTDAGIAWLTYDILNPLLRCLVIRKNADDLSDWIDRAKRMYEPFGGVHTGKPGEFNFPSGAKIKLGHLNDDNAYGKYLGHEYHRMLIEELTQIPRLENYLKLISSCRSTVSDLKPQIFMTTNPGSVGHDWVKERFVEPSEAGKGFNDPVTGRSRIFIKSLIDDNPYLMEADPDYVKYLEGLPEDLRKAWREGSWENVELKGAVYGKEIRRAEDSGRIGSFEYNAGLLVDTWWDLGVSDKMVIWFTQSVGERIHLIDYYENSNYGIQHYADVLRDKHYSYGTHHMPHDARNRQKDEQARTVKQIAEGLGIKPIEVIKNTSIINGVQATRIMFNRFYFDEVRCKEGLRALRNYQYEWDEKRQAYQPEPVKRHWTCHASDALRYLGVGHKKQEKDTEWGYKSAPVPINQLTGY